MKRRKNFLSFRLTMWGVEHRKLRKKKKEEGKERR